MVEHQILATLFFCNFFPVLLSWVTGREPNRWLKTSQHLDEPCCSPRNIHLAQGTGDRAGDGAGVVSQAVYALAGTPWPRNAGGEMSFEGGGFWKEKLVFVVPGQLTGSYLVLQHCKRRISLILRDSPQVMKQKNSPACND